MASVLECMIPYQRKSLGSGWFLIWVLLTIFDVDNLWDDCGRKQAGSACKSTFPSIFCLPLAFFHSLSTKLSTSNIVSSTHIQEPSASEALSLIWESYIPEQTPSLVIFSHNGSCGIVLARWAFWQAMKRYRRFTPSWSPRRKSERSIIRVKLHLLPRRPFSNSGSSSAATVIWCLAIPEPQAVCRWGTEEGVAERRSCLAVIVRVVRKYLRKRTPMLFWENDPDWFLYGQLQWWSHS